MRFNISYINELSIDFFIFCLGATETQKKSVNLSTCRVVGIIINCLKPVMDATPQKKLQGTNRHPTKEGSNSNLPRPPSTALRL